MGQTRTFPVPDGVVGERVDTGLARVLGISRTIAAQIADAGDVYVNGRQVSKSDRLTPDAMVEVTLPDPNQSRGLEVKPEAVEGMEIVYDDDDVVVIDKPVGVAAHPAVGWSGPTVVGALAAAGYRISTSGAAERQGIVHRLDAGTSGLMVVAKSEHAYTVL
jgi:23S rRNA pseudouridine1911/1915/1917 synthase